jgi:transglutaminase-like putative cysteine protease
VSARILALLGVLAALPAQAAPRFRPAPVPAWVTPIEPDRTARSQPEADSGLESLLEDVQTRLGARGKARFAHYADRVLTTEGIDSLSPLRIEFDPSFEQLQLHFVRIHRGKRVIDVLRNAEMKLLNVESELDRRLFDGRRSLVIVPRALRVGDVVESAFTITGRNPVLGDHALGYLDLGGDRTRRLHARLLREPGLPPLRFRRVAGAPVPAVRTSALGTEHVWDLADTAGVEKEDRVPPWYDQYPVAAYADFPSWEAVRDWALPLYPPRAPAPAMARRVAGWQRQSERAEDRALAALRFVQDEVRYLGFELGPNSHAPHPPERVFAQRFGDCKDKSYLLVTLLRAMGIEAQVALVDSDGHLAEELPTPFAFDHVIVRVAIGARVYWLDPTFNLQGGTLQSEEAPGFGKALVLRPGSPVLETIPQELPRAPTRVVHERYEVDDRGAATLEVTTTFERSDADTARADHADARPRQLDRHYLNFYSKQFPSVRSTRLPRIEDERPRNRFVIRESYAISNFWREQQVTLRAHLVDQELDEPDVRLRKAPLRLDFPVNVEHLIEVLLPNPTDIQTVDDRVERDGVAFHRVVGFADRLVSMRYTFATTARHVPAEGVAAHLAALEEVGGALEYTISHHAPATATPPPRHADEGGLLVATIVGLAAICAVIGGVIWIVFASVLRRAQTQDRRHRFEPAAGETAAGAIEVVSVEQASAAGERVSCGCGGRLVRPSATAFETSRLGDAEVHSARFVCDRCGRNQPLYFRVRATT